MARPVELRLELESFYTSGTRARFLGQLWLSQHAPKAKPTDLKLVVSYREGDGDSDRAEIVVKPGDKPVTMDEIIAAEQAPAEG